MTVIVIVVNFYGYKTSKNGSDRVQVMLDHG